MPLLRAASSSPTSTLCGSDTITQDNILTELSMWNDIDKSTPSVETWVPNGMFYRLNKILTYNNPHDARFSIGSTPVDCVWGEGSHDSYLVRHGRVVELWAVGHLKTMWFLAVEQDPQPRVRIGLDLLRDVDREAVRRLMNQASPSPSRSTWLATTDFCADQLNIKYRKVFQDIYDATTVFTNKQDMPTLMLTDLSIRDLVLVQCCFVRGRSDRRDPGVWTSWTTVFQLRAVSLLLPRPRDHAARIEDGMDSTLDVSL